MANWITKTPLPFPRSRGVSEFANNQVHYIGGEDAGFTPRKTHYSLDLLTNTWTTRADVPNITGGFKDMTSVFLNNRIWVFGGNVDGSHSSRLYIYNVDTNSWLRGVFIQTSYATAGIATRGGVDRIYLIGGYQALQWTGRTYEFDPNDFTFQEVAAKPTPVGYADVFKYGSELYVTGGFNSNFAQSIVEVYDADANVWWTYGNLPKVKWGHRVAYSQTDGKFYLLGGILFDTTLSKDVATAEILQFDPQTEAWTIAPHTLPEERAFHRAAQDPTNGHIYILGGADFDLIPQDEVWAIGEFGPPPQHHDLIAAAHATSQTAGDLSRNVGFAASIAATSQTEKASLTANKTIAGAAHAQSGTNPAGVFISRGLTGEAAAESTATAGISDVIRGLAAEAHAQSAADGTLDRLTEASGSIHAQSGTDPASLAATKATDPRTIHATVGVFGTLAKAADVRGTIAAQSRANPAGLFANLATEGSVESKSTTTAAVHAHRGLEAAAAPRSTTTGTVTIQRTLQAAAAATTDTDALLHLNRRLDGQVEATTDTIAAATTEKELAGSMGAAATVQGFVQTEAETVLIGHIGAFSTLTGGMDTAKALNAEIRAISTVSEGEITRSIALVETIEGKSTAEADLLTENPLMGSIFAASTTDGSAQIQQTAEGTAAARSTTAAHLAAGRPITAAIHGQSGTERPPLNRAFDLFAETITARSELSVNPQRFIDVEAQTKAVGSLTARLSRAPTITVEPIAGKSGVQKANAQLVREASGTLTARSGLESELTRAHTLGGAFGAISGTASRLTKAFSVDAELHAGATLNGFTELHQGMRGTIAAASDAHGTTTAVILFFGDLHAQTEMEGLFSKNYPFAGMIAEHSTLNGTLGYKGDPLISEIFLQGLFSPRVQIEGQRHRIERLEGVIQVARDNQDIEMYEGDTKQIYVTVFDEDGNRIDLTSAVQIEWTAFLRYKGPFLIQKTTNGGGITITDAEAGEFLIELDTIDTDDHTGTFYHHARILDHNDFLNTVMTGRLFIKPTYD